MVHLEKRLSKLEAALARYDARVKKAFEEYHGEIAAIKEELRKKKLEKVRRKIYGHG